GIGPVTAEQVKTRQQTLRFYRQGGRVQKVEGINGSGRLTAMDNGAGKLTPLQRVANPKDADAKYTEISSIEFKPHQDGSLFEEIARNRAGAVMWTLQYTSPATGQYVRSGFPESRTPSGAQFVKFEFTSDGLQKKAFFLDRLGKPAVNEDGVYAE